MKKEKVITLRMNKRSYDIIEEYAEAHGLSVNAYLNSIADAQAEWFIPFSSYEIVMMPKKLLFSLFEAANDDRLERMAQQWGSEGRNGVLLTSGDFTLESAIDLARKAAKYWVSSDLKVSSRNNENDNGLMNNDILLVLRHDLGKNFSFFWARTCFHFFSLLKSRKVSVNYDSTTVSIELERLN